MIPFLGLLVPALVLAGIALSHRITPHHPHAAADLHSGAEVHGAQPAVASAVAEAPIGAEPAVPESLLCQFLRESDVFEGLTDEELLLVAAISEHRRVRAGARLANAGSRGATLFLIIEGEIQLLSHPPAETVVRTARAGETVPLAAIIDPPVLVTTVEARTDCEVLAIPRQPLIDLLEVNPMMGFQVYRAVAHAFEHRYRHTLDLGGIDQAPHGADEGG
jgi:hypothetical protein